MGCYYLTATRGEEGENGRGRRRHDLPQPGGGVPGLRRRASSACTPAIQVRLPIEKKVIGEVRDRQGQDRASRRSPRKPNGLVQTTVGRVHLQRHPPPEDGVLRPAAVEQAPEPHHRRLLPAARPRARRIDLLDRMKDIGFRESTRAGLSLRHRRPADARRTRSTILKETEKEVEKVRSSTSAASSPSGERYNKVIDCGRTPARRSPSR